MSVSMIRFISLLATAAYWFACASYASELSEPPRLTKRMGVNINGEIKVQAKYQDSFKTPFDNPEWENHTKSGANHKES